MIKRGDRIDACFRSSSSSTAHSTHVLPFPGAQYVDLLLLHAPTCWEGLCEEDPSRGSWQDAWRALETLYDQGKVRAIGVSNFDVRLLEELSGVAKVPVQAVQNWQDPLHQDREVGYGSLAISLHMHLGCSML